MNTQTVASYFEAITVMLSRIADLKTEIQRLPGIDLRRATYERQVRDLIGSVIRLNPDLSALLDRQNPEAAQPIVEHVCMPMTSQVRCIDQCIHDLVSALSVGNVRTIALSCGDSKYPPLIILDDGRVLVIFNSLVDFDKKFSGE